ncbi:MAG TPA: RDD family protein [Thermoanaerobaculia bacterium]|nr:RDD family protein [Thermoanaerobaculia bacterium]
MRRPDEDSDDQLLFDLPLDPAAEVPRRAEPRRPVARPRPESAPAPAPRRPLVAREEEEDEEEFELTEEEASAAGRAGLVSRLAAGAADLLVHAATLMILLIGTRMLGVRPTLSDAPALGLFLLAFSFLYTIVPLAFWGHTLGMAWAGLVAQNRDGEPLTFDQTARRWLGALLTLAAAGLPLLVALSGRSLADLLSGSVTWSERGGEVAEPEAA